MDIATVIGFLASLGVIVYAMIDSASLDSFIEGTSIAIVFAGSIMVLLMRSKLGDFINTVSYTHLTLPTKA